MNFTGSLSGEVTGTQTLTVVSTVGGQPASNVASATVLANASSSSNGASTIVPRDANGSFSANVITTNLSRAASIAINDFSLRPTDKKVRGRSFPTTKGCHFHRLLFTSEPVRSPLAREFVRTLRIVFAASEELPELEA